MPFLYLLLKIKQSQSNRMEIENSSTYGFTRKGVWPVLAGFEHYPSVTILFKQRVTFFMKIERKARD